MKNCDHEQRKTNTLLTLMIIMAISALLIFNADKIGWWVAKTFPPEISHKTINGR